MAFDFLAHREKFLVLDMTGKGTGGLYFSLDDDRNLVFEKYVRRINLKKSFGSPTRNITQKSWEGNYLFASRRKTIAIASSDIATTIPIPLELTRERLAGQESLGLAELENMVAQAMARIFNQCRKESATRLKVDDLDAILVGANAGHVKIDGRPVADPVGHPGKKISLLLELTFAVRRAFEDLKPLFNSPEEFFFMESAQAELLAFAEVRPLPQNLIVAGKNGGAGSSLFILQNAPDGYPVLYRENLHWDFSPLLQAIRNAFGVGEKAAEGLYSAYRTGMTSAAAARHFGKVIKPGMELLFAEVAKAKLKGPLYLDTPYALPFETPRRQGTATFEAMPINEVMDKFGFSAELAAWPIPQNVIIRNLAPLFRAYFEKNSSEINKKLRRRLHWLTE